MAKLLTINEEYRISEMESEIQAALTDAKEQASPITIWQESNGGKKINHALIKELNPKLQSIMFFIGDQEIHINKDAPIFIYCKRNHKSFIFKSSIKQFNGRFLFVKIPNSLRIHEHREHPRFAFDSNNLPVILGNFSSSLSGAENTALSFKCSYEFLAAELVDISNKGLSFYAKKIDVIKLKTGMQVRITHIGNALMAHALKGEIRYIRQAVSNKDIFKRIFYQVGVMFEKNIDLNLIFHEVCYGTIHPFRK
ncbi:MAG: hypothetical protein HQK50_13370 [Oligoflexia bacterium]|nr:hypothetical protein [Oligoflexia bacterium]